MAEKITWTNERRTLAQLKPWERNPRQISRDQAKRLAESFDAFGQVETIAIGPDNEVYNGHQRLNVLMTKHGADYEVEVRVSSRALTEKEREKLTVYLHKGAAGEWNFDTLSEWDVQDLVEWGFEPEELGITIDEPKAEDPGAQVDKAEELREKWKVGSGQLWRLGEHRLICGDCTDRAVVERVMGGEKAKYGMHDPPYGIDVVGSTSDSGGAKGFGKIGFNGAVPVNHYSPVIGDDRPFDPSGLLAASEFSILWGANYYADKLPAMKGWLVWDKKGRDNWRDNFSDCELAWSNLKSVTRIFRHTWLGMVQEGEREKRVHPTQKPVALFEKMMGELFSEEGLVIDYYLGSGTTLIACERLGRKCRAVEISPAYCAVAIQRWVDMTGGVPELIS